LHGLFVWGACFDILNKEHTGWLLLIGVAIKLGYEQLGGDTQAIAELIGASVAVDAHLYGAVSGLILGLVFIVLSAQKPAPDATV
jgi:membrane associated rhomboid family serine protease